MNILLFLPGLLVVLFQYRGLGGMLESSSVILAIQVSLLLRVLEKSRRCKTGIC